MLNKRFIIRTIIFIVTIMIIFAVSGSVETIMSNYIALGQMENSDMAFIIMETYNNAIKPVVNLIKGLIVAVFIWITGVDVYKIIRRKNEGEKKDENI